MGYLSILPCFEKNYNNKIPLKPLKNRKYTQEPGLPRSVPLHKPLSALYQLQRAGITHLKLVGRGNYTDFMEHDIRNLRKALKILEQCDSEELYQKIMKQTLFSKGCSGNCYYRENVAHR